MGPARTAFLLAAATSATLIALVVVSARTIEDGEISLAEAKLDFILAETESTIERNLGLGLPLAELQQVEPLIERAVARTPEVLAVDVFSAGGVTLFSTDRGAIGEFVPAAWLAAIAEQRREPRWRSVDRDAATVGVALRNDFGGSEGFVALTLMRSALALPLSRVPELLIVAAPTIAAATALAFAAGWLVGGAVDRRLWDATDALQRRDAEPVRRGADALAAAVAAAIARTGRAGEEVEAATLEVRRIDAEI